MTSDAERASLVAEAERIIREGSKSFRFASNLFDQRTRERAWLLYAWCRACDDLADGQTLGHGATAPADPDRRIEFLRENSSRALAGESVGLAPFDALRIVAAECEIPPRLIEDHLEGFALDAAGWAPNDEDDLLRYCYHVAGAVGCMMAAVMGVSPRDQDTLNRAADLGIAFQLANISRDIVEDAAVGRRYVPSEWLREGSIDRGQLVPIAARLRALVDIYEASARVGAARLPFRSRWAVLSAANIYGEIARKVERQGASAWDRRTYVKKAEKMRLVVRALLDGMKPPGDFDRGKLWTRPTP